MTNLSAVSQDINKKSSYLIRQMDLNNYSRMIIGDLSVKENEYKNWIIQLDTPSELWLGNSFSSEINSKDRLIDALTPFEADGANLRIVDKIYGTTHEISVFKHLNLDYLSLRIKLDQCFYDNDSLNRESLALLYISDDGIPGGVYDGWMSSRYSHLTNYNNYRYSVWLLSCIISNQE